MALSLQAEIIINGKYKVTKVLKTGAVAQAALVLSQIDPLGPPFVLRLSIDGEGMRLKEEARILRQLSSLNGQGEPAGPAPEAAAFVDEGTYNGAYYLVTEYIPHDLYTTVGQAWEQGRGEEWMVPVGRAFLQFLAKIHEQGIEYYDIKLDHLFWDDTKGILRVIDFNLCKAHAANEPDTWQQEDLRGTAILMVQMLQKSQNLPLCRYPVPMPEAWSSLDVRALANKSSDATQSILGWLHGGFYTNAQDAANDFARIERDPAGKTESGRRPVWLNETLESRESQANALLQQANESIAKGHVDTAWALLHRAWVCLPFKGVEASPIAKPLPGQVKVYLYALRLRYLSQDPSLAAACQLWLNDQYDDALRKLDPSTHSDAPTILAWLKRRRDIDDPQRVHWNKVISLIGEGHHAQAQGECEKYCRQYPTDANAALWLEYLKKILEPLRSHWWYDREDRLYPLAMARLPKRLEETAADSPLRPCWQQDEQLQEMCRQMRRAVEITDQAWQHFAACAFGMAAHGFGEAKNAAAAAIALHAQAINLPTGSGMAIMERVIGEWTQGANNIAGLEETAHQMPSEGRGFLEIQARYNELLQTALVRLDIYLKEQRPRWDVMLPLPPEKEAFPQEDLLRLFRVAEGLLGAFVQREEKRLVELAEIRLQVQTLDDRQHKLGKDLEQERNQLIATQKHEESLNREIIATQESLKVSETDKAKIKTKLDQVQAELDKTIADRNEQQERLVTRQEALDAITEEKGRLETELAQARQRGFSAVFAGLLTLLHDLISSQRLKPRRGPQDDR